jgi:large conductance mechanosensitive channel
MLKGFKDFILRGNVVDLAVAVVIGAAFGAIVTAFTSGIIQPLINAVSPPGSAGLGFPIVDGKETTYVDLSAIITAALNFLIVAAVVYFVIVLPLNKLKERRERGEEAGPSEPTDVELLIEIRDLLRTQRSRD